MPEYSRKHLPKEFQLSIQVHICFESSVLFSSLGALIPRSRFACDQVALMTEFSDYFCPLMTEAAKGREGLEEQVFLG